MDMFSFIVGIIVGIIIGANVGFLVIATCVASKHTVEHDKAASVKEIEHTKEG